MLEDRRSGERLTAGYHVFHLLSKAGLVDRASSRLFQDGTVRSLALASGGEYPPMCRNAWLLDFVFVREDMAAEMENAKITGCRLTLATEYSSR